MPVIHRSIRVGWELRVFFTENVFDPANPALKDALADEMPRRVLVVLEDSLAQARPDLEDQIQKYFSVHGGKLILARPPLFVPGGEAAKNSITIVTDILSHIDRHHIDRQSYVIAVGGGALLDVAGFAAATAHRGVRLVRVPTTTLAQADSGVGVKNSINAFGKKNFVGTFAPPHAIINDFNLLATLRPREKRAGYVEAVKVACIHDAAFFDEIEQGAPLLVAFEPAAMKRVIYRSAELHVQHIATGGDPFETGSARPLDFGHWAAHKLEQMSSFNVPHGEAVAIGIALDSIYSRLAGLLDPSSCARILATLERLGFRLFAPELLNSDREGRLHILAGLDEFREHLGGRLTVTLLKGIGAGVEVHEMDAKNIVAAIGELQAR
ncbi:MAG: 3-dehydroquinate synthase [Verrucomicrobia bacterium]|nr:3-dehydroquinate synthase [Verrucomicrobiota bacterium]MDE3098834.1 3-dehydroquinate synthase [Verrucomicrobiota bacterium]